MRAVADAAALALERARLDAELRAKLEELKASRTRIVEAGYAASRRLERDLHDGAQQRLVSLALALRLVEDRMADDPTAAARLLADARAELSEVMDELRDFARGLHPGVLSTRGLDAALEALAARAPLPVEVRGRLDERLPERMEAAAYYVVAEGAHQRRQVRRGGACLDRGRQKKRQPGRGGRRRRPRRRRSRSRDGPARAARPARRA